MRKTIILVGAVLLSFLFVAPSVEAGGFLARNGQITAVTNTNNNGARFSVLIEGGTGICADDWVMFDQSNAGDEEVFKRAYAAALTAIATGLLVHVYSYGAVDCAAPSYILLKN